MASLMKQYKNRKCWNCDLTEGGSYEDGLGGRADGPNSSAEVKLRKCSGCLKSKHPDPALYCGSECQRKHWKNDSRSHPKHKGKCQIVAKELQGGKDDWCKKFRGTQDGSFHHGELELITWDYIFTDETGDVVELGWGNVYKDESEEFKEKFIRTYGSSKKKFLKAGHNSAFRWTCCGDIAAEGLYGCSHHGAKDLSTNEYLSQYACTCDFCRAGLPLSDKIWNKKINGQGGAASKGLDHLCQGPDERSQSAAGARNFGIRQAMGGDECVVM